MKKDEKLNISGKKNVDLDRFGMGFGNCRSGILYLVILDMQIIEQELFIMVKLRKKYNDDSDDLYFIFSLRYFDEVVELRSSFFFSWDDSLDFYWKKEISKDIEIILKIIGYLDRFIVCCKLDYELVENIDEVQKKFGNVKVILLDMYFGR